MKTLDNYQLVLSFFCGHISHHNSLFTCTKIGVVEIKSKMDEMVYFNGQGNRLSICLDPVLGPADPTLDLTIDQSDYTMLVTIPEGLFDALIIELNSDLASKGISTSDGPLSLIEGTTQYRFEPSSVVNGNQSNSYSFFFASLDADIKYEATVSS